MAPAPHPVIVRQVTTKAAIERNLLELRAAEAYAIHAFRIGWEPGWSNLAETQRQAWREVVQWLDSTERRCPKCDIPIWCHKCGGDS